ncbi:hypothetical protein Q428_00775 [Fervidicella metallireducens AeB]|uniref:N-acetyltransferase domain-containing protein n=1 Tax=Fervidicella metallireducens AeB TaxID=1403537 RepID=A0A017RZ25_9CLOT|nr:GNAT family N-acetyltransferase [Fervidicella metallireducens]EYE89841.1 hypothetical protein Q428_00775 [Fervidicella metallireducens AeB]
MIRLLTNADKEVVLEYAENHHIECTFIIGNVIGVGIDNNKEINRSGDYYGYFEDGKLQGILPFYNIGSCIPHYENDKAVICFAEIMKKKTFSFLLGMEKIVRPLYEAIKETKDVKKYGEDSYYINNNYTPYNLEGIDFKYPHEIDEDKVTNFMIHAYEDGFDTKINYEEIKKMLKQRVPGDDFLFLLKDGKILAQGCIQTSTSKICQIGGVYTLDTERGKGYCKALISELCRMIIARGKTPTLMVSKKNTPAVKAYNSIGFRHYDDYNIIEFKQ